MTPIAAPDETYVTAPDWFAQDILRVTPHPRQAEWLCAKATVKTGAMGRRFGKSFAAAIDLIHFGMTRPGTSQFVFAPTADQSRIIMRYAEKMLYDADLMAAVQKTTHAPYPHILLGNGSTIQARTVGDSGVGIRGHGADRVILDEAAYMPGTIIEEVVGPMLSTSEHGELVLISTPFGLNHFYEYYQRGQEGRPGHASFRFPSADNPHVSPSYLEQQRREMTTMAYSVEYEALFSEDQNAAFPWTLIQSCADQTTDLPPEPNHRYTIGYDPAKWSDRSGVVVLDITSRPYRVCRVQDISGRDYLTQAAAVKELASTYGRAQVLLDATSHDQMLEQLIADGVTASGFRFTNESKNELINGLVICMEQGDLRLTNHRDLLDELKYYRYELTRSGNVKLGADEKHHDDLVTALALAVHHAASAPDLPYAWLRNDPEFRERALAPETDADRVARRRLAQGL